MQAFARPGQEPRDSDGTTPSEDRGDFEEPDHEEADHKSPPIEKFFKRVSAALSKQNLSQTFIVELAPFDRRHTESFIVATQKPSGDFQLHKVSTPAEQASQPVGPRGGVPRRSQKPRKPKPPPTAAIKSQARDIPRPSNLQPPLPRPPDRHQLPLPLPPFRDPPPNPLPYREYHLFEPLRQPPAHAVANDAPISSASSLAPGVLYPFPPNWPPFQRNDFPTA